MKQKKSNRDWKLILTFMAMLVVFMFIGYKLFDIQYNDTNIVVTHDPTIRIVDAPRGNILSEDGRILSVTMPVYDVRLDLYTIDKQLFEKEVTNLSIEINKMFPDKSASSYEILLRENKNKRYFLLKRNVSYIQLQEMKKFPIFRLGKNRGGFIQEMKSTRDYPFGSLGKITVGKVKIFQTVSGKDSIVPENGIELAFNEYLQGVQGKEMNQEISGKVLVPKSIKFL
jgi:cell division protein FtsI (penicillin-binding protein 3)